MKILFLESFFGGSHKDFALGFQQTSRHQVDLETLPARFWKWRMRGAAVYFADKIKALTSYDVVFATDMMDLTDFMALCGRGMPPVLLYFHENQLDYPLSPGEKRDFHLGFTNIVSAVAADAVMFNSKYHFSAFMRHSQKLLAKLPDFVPDGVMDGLSEKTQVAYPGCRFPAGPLDVKPDIGRPPLIIWNHRWEHDKGPDRFFSILCLLKSVGINFHLAVMGENFTDTPEAFRKIEACFKDRIQVFGYVGSRRAYTDWLKKGDIVLSCALQENFGISVVEAVRYGCLPLLPDRLSYPELVPDACHSKFIYTSEAQCVEKLKAILKNPGEYSRYKTVLSREMEKFSWDIRVKQYDRALETLHKSR